MKTDFKGDHVVQCDAECRYTSSRQTEIQRDAHVFGVYYFCCGNLPFNDL